MSASVIGANEFEHSEGFKVYLSVIGKNKFDPAAAQFYFRKQRLRHYTRDDHRENNDGDISAEIRFDILFCEPSLFMPSVQDGARSGDDKKRKHLYAKNDYIFHLSSRLNNFYREVKTSDMKGFLEKYDYRLRFPQIENDIKTDVLVIGGGLKGVITAYRARQKGLRVVLAERFFIGSGRTSFIPGVIVPNFKKSDAMSRYASAVKNITELAYEAGGIKCSLLPFYFFSGKLPALPKGTRSVCGEDLTDFRQSVPDGIFAENGCLCLPAVRFCKNLAERCRLSGACVFEKTRIVSVFDGFATTDRGFEIKYGNIINATDAGCAERTERRFLLRAQMRGENIPRIAFGDDMFRPLTAYSENGKNLTVCIKSGTYCGALTEKKRLEESLSPLLGVSLKIERSCIGKTFGAFSLGEVYDGIGEI